ncbi:DUF4221 family protein [Fulvivirgaceae bacterium PWU4]|uniref:DUF4221 family protein n=1 Tax=Chryseosolibacter histidini TaxID=2782349 RepID=A0AAP2DMM9_9BACT|nr:DUF4221 family protein [Chryseosolibacter histidini]MBT1699138.1 DUF4221 family protein [Chryseosolibacter histidini]
MNYKKRYIYVLSIVSILLIGAFCFHRFKYEKKLVNRKSLDGATVRRNVKINVVETKTYHLDSATSPYTLNYFQLYNHGKRQLLTFLNKEANTIYFYDFCSQKIDSIIHLADLGYRSKRVSGYKIISFDTLLLYCSYPSEMTLHNATGNPILKKSFKKDYSVSPWEITYPVASTRTPIIYCKPEKMFLFGGHFLNEFVNEEIASRVTSFTSLNMDNGLVSHFINYPDFYNKNVWGGGTMRQFFFDYNDSTQHLVVSFMADHAIRIYDLSGKESICKEASSYYFDEIVSMEYDRIYSDLIADNEIYTHYLKNPTYGMILYDKYRKLYYRVAELPLKGPFDRRLFSNRKTEALIILDEKFNKLGELLLPERAYDLNNMVVTEKGLGLKFNDRSDDKLVFHIVTFEGV